MIIVSEEIERHAFNDRDGKEDADAYFVIRTELPYEGFSEYMDAALNYHVVPGGKEDEMRMEAESNKLTLSQIQDILMKWGLVEVHGIIEAKSQTAITDWHKLPAFLLGQILKAIQANADKQQAYPNSVAPSVES